MAYRCLECGHVISDDGDLSAHLILCSGRMVGPVETGRNGMGLRWARCGEWRLVAYAEGGFCEQRRVEGFGWCLLHDCDEIPAEVRGALTEALENPS